MHRSPLQERLQAAIGTRTYRQVGDLTATPAETVRRYVVRANPSVEFVTALCGALAISPEWLLTGRGPMLARHQARHALTEASLADLLQEAGRRVQDLQDRLVGLERDAESLAGRVDAVGVAPAADASEESSGDELGQPHAPPGGDGGRARRVEADRPARGDPEDRAESQAARGVRADADLEPGGRLRMPKPPDAG